MDPLQQLLSSITGETEQMNNIAPAPWQQELLDTVSPEKAQKRRIAQALAQASTAMATTPGDFLSGVSAAAATGANSYIQGGEDMDAERIKAMAAVDTARRREQEAKLDRLHRLFTATRSAERDASGGEFGPGNTRAQHLTNMRHIDNELASYERVLRERDKENRAAHAKQNGPDEMVYTDPNIIKMSEGLIKEELRKRRAELEQRYGIRGDAPEGTSDQEQGILDAPQAPAERIVGQTYSTPKGLFVWTGKGWKPVQ